MSITVAVFFSSFPHFVSDFTFGEYGKGLYFSKFPSKAAQFSAVSTSLYEPRCEKTGFFAYAKTKTQISFAVTAKLISAFGFATRIVQSLYFLNTKFQASSHPL